MSKTNDNYQHKEAFALMWYACPCGHRERIWNSRDGVTPFGGILCTSCGGKGLEKRGLSHVDFYLDEPVVDHKLRDGQQFFRDGTAADAVAILNRRFAYYISIGQQVPRHVVEKMMADAHAQSGEWQAGWPMVDRHDARLLTRSPKAREGDS